MSTIKVTIDAAAIQQFAGKLAELGSETAQRALADALNKVGDRVRTQEKRTLAKQSGVQYSRIDMRTHRAIPGHLQYEIIQPGDETNITDFSGRQLAAGVAARPWAKGHLFAGTFQVRKYGWRTFHRLGKGHLPIKPVYGPNLARELLKDEAREVFGRAPAQLAPQIEAQITRLGHE